MATAREVKRRIKSVKNTMQITRAMQMIAATKMKKAQEAAQITREYAKGLFEIVNKMGGVPADYSSPFFRDTKPIRNTAVILVGPLKGFSGGLPTNLLLHTDRFISNLVKDGQHSKSHVHIIAVNKVGHKLANSLPYNLDASFLDLTDHATLADIEPIYRYVRDQFSDEKFDEVFISFPEFISTLKQEPKVNQILPITAENLEHQAAEKLSADVEPLFEPSTTQVLDELLPKYLRIQIYQAFLNLVASEYSSRMVAMKNATDNAKDLANDLTIVYNQSRQAGITNELLEISASTLG